MRDRTISRRPDAVMSAIVAIGITQWYLITLTRLESFAWWPVALIGLLIALGILLLAYVQQEWRDQLTLGGILLVGIVLFTPPAEHLPFFGDSAIYPNEGIFIAEQGTYITEHAALAAIPPAARTLFYTTNVEQFPNHPLHSYQGIVYGGYYVVDAATMTIRTSRMAMSEVWLALLYQLGGIRIALYSTPLFGIAALLLLYAVSRHFLNRAFALWVVAILAISYPQIHFARTSYAEMAGQFWTLAGLLFALQWLDRRTPKLLVVALFCWVTTWSGRIDALILLGGVGLLLLYAAYARDRRSLQAVSVALPGFAGLLWIGTNAAYVGATYEILIWRWPWFGQALLLLAVGLLVSLPLFWGWGSAIVAILRRSAPSVHLLVFLALFFVVFWATVPNPWRNPELTRNFQEIIWFSSAYLTPGLYWLMVAGVGWLLWRGYTAKTFWVLASFLILAAVFFYRYTSAPVYPVSLRRLLSDVIPLMAIFAGMALAATWPLPAWPRVRWVIALLMLLWMGGLASPLFQQHEAAGSLATIEQLQATLPPDAVVIFEIQDSDSWVGWLAAPLYSIYQRWSLMLDSDQPDPHLLQQAVDAFMAHGRAVYLVSQHEPLPTPLLPPGYTATLQQQLIWQSSLLGQTRAPYPPPYWEFTFPIQLYRLDRQE